MVFSGLVNATRLARRNRDRNATVEFMGKTGICRFAGLRPSLPAICGQEQSAGRGSIRARTAREAEFDLALVDEQQQASHSIHCLLLCLDLQAANYSPQW